MRLRFQVCLLSQAWLPQDLEQWLTCRWTFLIDPASWVVDASHCGACFSVPCRCIHPCGAGSTFMSISRGCPSPSASRVSCFAPHDYLDFLTNPEIRTNGPQKLCILLSKISHMGWQMSTNNLFLFSLLISFFLNPLESSVLEDSKSIMCVSVCAYMYVCLCVFVCPFQGGECLSPLKCWCLTSKDKKSSITCTLAVMKLSNNKYLAVHESAFTSLTDWLEVFTAQGTETWHPHCSPKFIFLSSSF